MNPSDRVWRERGLRNAILAGDQHAWQIWYEESFEGLAAYVAWRCAGLRDLTEEVVQETWLTAVRRIRSFDPEQGSFAGWLRGIAANILRNRFRDKARHGSEVPLQNGHVPRVEAVPIPRQDTDLAERIARALAMLPERYEAVLRAKYLDQQSVGQIAETWKETPKAIESLLTRARQAFREIYSILE
ncbi:MAG TPA: sigma-70 family RNA polymerase sigma factor [Gemmataceae bacterium]|nr:sigma-70 family RNA polymerase sigma factor [Gemmataceae bacterium]